MYFTHVEYYRQIFIVGIGCGRRGSELRIQSVYEEVVSTFASVSI